MPSRRGSKNKRTLEFDELYDGYVNMYGDPVEAMFTMARDVEVDVSIRAKLLSDLARLKHPTKKAIEVQGEIQTEVLVHLDPGGQETGASHSVLGASRAPARELPPPELPDSTH